MRGAHAYALGYWGMVGWKTKILMGLSTPLTVVVTSAWDSLMSIVAVGSSGYVQDNPAWIVFDLCKGVSDGAAAEGDDATMSLLQPRGGGDSRWGTPVYGERWSCACWVPK